MINRWIVKLWIKNLTIQIPSLNYNNTYIEDSKYWNILLLPFSLFNQNQSFKDNSNSIKPNTYIHMNIKNSKNKINNLQKTLPNTITSFFFFFFFPDCVFLDGAPRTNINVRDYTAEWCWKNNPKKTYLKYNIGMKSQVEIVTNNP